MAQFSAMCSFLNRPRDEQVPIMVETDDNNHNFSCSEGFWQILKISIFPYGSKSQISKKMLFFFYETYFGKLSIARKILLNNWNYMSLEGCLKLRSRWYPYGPQKTTHSGANLSNFGHFWPFEMTTLEICLL